MRKTHSSKDWGRVELYLHQNGHTPPHNTDFTIDLPLALNRLAAKLKRDAVSGYSAGCAVEVAAARIDELEKALHYIMNYHPANPAGTPAYYKEVIVHLSLAARKAFYEAQ